MAEPESLKVIALISGGKDSFFSLLHCLQNGHQVVALANLYPPGPVTSELTPVLNGDKASLNIAREEGVGEGEADEEHEEQDLNSFMYQTVGHTVIDLYEQALGIPLYRQPIIGAALSNGSTYSPRHEGDETESLVPLLKRIMEKHPEVNALSTGAILSTYQRTRVESVALRLGLKPLGFLWKYPVLPPGSHISLLEDMEAANLDARIIKVASGGLDETFLWENVADPRVRARIERAVKRFGSDGDGAVLGEGGEFETLVLDGPSGLFKGRIHVRAEGRKIVREGGGSAWLSIRGVTVVMKETQEIRGMRCRVPELLDERFRKILESLKDTQNAAESSTSPAPNNTKAIPLSFSTNPSTTLYGGISPTAPTSSSSVSEQAEFIISQIKTLLAQRNLPSTSITSVIIILRSMTDFATTNEIYSALFPEPNPPARVTLSCGSLLLESEHLRIYVQISTLPVEERRALHVQSRSYWAPANIGPYSQAISIPTTSSSSSGQRVVSIAGQIALIPHTMTLPSPPDFALEAVLSLQHLHRIAIDMSVSWFTSAVAFLPISSSRDNEYNARIASKVWSSLHQRREEDEKEGEEERDLWEEKHYASAHTYGSNSTVNELPDWEAVDIKGEQVVPPFFAAEVEELPKGAGVEWHAHQGITSGPIVVHPMVIRKSWTIYQTSFGGRLQTVLLLYHLSAPEPKNTETGLEEVLRSLGLADQGQGKSTISYVDIAEVMAWPREFGEGVIPCHRLWDANGEKLSASIIFDSTVED